MSWKVKIYLLLEDEFISGYHIHNDGSIHPIIWKENNTVFCHNCGEEHEIHDEEIEKEEIDNFWISDYKYGKYIHLGITAPKYHVHTNGERHRCVIISDRISCNKCNEILNLKTNHSEIIYYQRKKISALSEMQILVANGRVFWFKTIIDDEEKYFCFNGFRAEISEGYTSAEEKIVSADNPEIIYDENSLIFELDEYPNEEKLFSKEIKKKPTKKNPTLSFTPPIGNEVVKKEKTLVPDGGLAPMKEGDEDDRFETSPYLHTVDEDEEKRPTVVVDAIPVNTGEFDSIVDIPQEEDNNDSIFEVPDEDDDENEEDQNFDDSTPLPSENSPVINSEDDLNLEEKIKHLEEGLVEDEEVEDIEFAANVMKIINPEIDAAIKKAEGKVNTAEKLAKKIIEDIIKVRIPEEKQKVLLHWEDFLQRTVKALKKDGRKNEESRLIQFSEKLEELLSAEEDRITAREYILEKNTEANRKETIRKAVNSVEIAKNEAIIDLTRSQQNFDEHLKLQTETLEQSKIDGLKAYDERLITTAKDLKKSSRSNWFWVIVFVIIFGIALSILSFALSLKLYQKANRENTALAEKLIKQEKSFKKLENAEKELKTALKTAQSKNAAMLIKFENSFNDQQAKWQLSVKDADEYFWSYHLWSYWIYLDKSTCCDNLKKAVPKKKRPRLAPKAKKRKSQKGNYFETTTTDENGKVKVEKAYY